MAPDEIDELVEGLSSDIKADFRYGPWVRHGIVIIGGVFGVLTFVVVKLAQFLMRAPIPQNVSGTCLTLVAILFSLAGGFILPSVRAMQTEEALLLELPDRMRLALRRLESRGDLKTEAKAQLRELKVQDCRDRHASRAGIPFRRMSLTATVQWLLPEASLALLFLFFQPFFPYLYDFVVLFLAIGYATAFMAMTLVYPSVERTLQRKWIQR